MSVDTLSLAVLCTGIRQFSVSERQEELAWPKNPQRYREQEVGAGFGGRVSALELMLECHSEWWFVFYQLYSPLRRKQSGRSWLAPVAPWMGEGVGEMAASSNAPKWSESSILAKA